MHNRTALILAGFFTVLAVAFLTAPLIAAEPPSLSELRRSRKPVEGPIKAFRGEAKFEMRQLFTGERMPNVVVATDGTVLATWGVPKGVWVRRSEDGGKTWKDLAMSKVLPDGPQGKGCNGCLGGLMRLPIRGRDILVYSNCDSPTRERKNVSVWASFDGAKTWLIKRRVYDGPSADYSSR